MDSETGNKRKHGEAASHWCQDCEEHSKEKRHASQTDEYPLHQAATVGDVERVRELIGRGADTRLRDGGGRTPLHRALYWGREAAAELLAGADCRIDVEDEHCHTPLHYAAMRGYVTIICKLLAAGSRTRAEDLDGRTPLHHALIYEREAASELLAEADGGNDVWDFSGLTPLHLAATCGYVKTIGKLLAGGSDTRVRTGWGMTALHRALAYGQEAAAELLAEADCGMEGRDNDGMTPFHLAVQGEFQGVVRKIVLGGTNPHMKNRDGVYPIELALERRMRNETIPKMILSSYALRGIPVDRAELHLGEGDLLFCAEELSRCDAEIRLMEHTRVPASSLSYLDLVSRHVARVVSRLPVEGVAGVSRHRNVRRDFPVYADLVVSGLRAAGERRGRTDRCLECFSLLSPPLPATCADVVLLCLGDDDLENFVRAVRPESE